MTLVNFLTGQFVILIDSGSAGPFPPADSRRTIVGPVVGPPPAARRHRARLEGPAQADQELASRLVLLERSVLELEI